METFKEGHGYAQKYKVGKDVDRRVAEPLCFAVQAFAVADAIPKVMDWSAEE